jgi:hypothetical protein
LELCEEKEERGNGGRRKKVSELYGPSPPIHVKHCYHFHSVLRGHLLPMKVSLLRGGAFLI